MISQRILTGVILCFAVVLAGCPIPLPTGYPETSRENLGDEVTSLLEVDVSTREDVLLLLGEPDGTAPNNEWLSFGSVYQQGGVLFVLCGRTDCLGAGGETMEYKRLVLRFDDNGLMTDINLVTQECWEGIFVGGNNTSRSAPCMQIDAPDSGSGSLATDKSVSDGKTEPRSMSVIAVRHKWMDTLDQRAKALHRDRSELLPLAEAGEVEAQYELAQISDNADERWYWTCVAAHGGHIRSQILMGARHLTGSLSDGDTEPVEAYVWYSLASRNGDSQTEGSLPELAKAMTPEQVHDARTRLKSWIPEPRRCDLYSANATR